MGLNGPLAWAAAPVVWTTSEMNRLTQTTPPGAERSIKIYALKDEVTSFQIGIQVPTGALTGVSVTAGAMNGPGGYRISGSDIILFREQFVSVPDVVSWRTNRRNPPGPGGLYPDGLIPFVDPDTGKPAIGGLLQASPFQVDAGINQVIWVDVHVPPGILAGDYTESFTISADQGSATVSATLHVWNYTLPRIPSFKSAYQAAASNQSDSLARALLRERLTPNWGLGSKESEYVGTFGLNSVNVGLYNNINISNCTSRAMPAPPSVSSLRSLYAAHDSRLVIYGNPADEISACANQFPSLVRWAKQFHTADSNLQIACTVTPFPGLEDDGTGSGRSAVDIWEELPKQWDANQAKLEKLQAKGDAVWLYNVLEQDDYSPKLAINWSPLDWRLSMGFISATLGLKGFQQWSVDLWSADPWHRTSPAAGADPAVPSDGMEIYPGAPVGIVGYAPSMRMKWSRDGTNDYEYVQILKTLGEGAWALQQAAAVGPDWTNWTRDYTKLEAVRISLGNKIDQLSTAPSPIVLPRETAAAVRVYPNPWRKGTSENEFVTFSGVSPGSTLTIFTVSGRFVARRQTSDVVARWDLLTDAGDKAASGLYFYLIQDKTGAKTRGRLAIIR